jgi:hypothetical protein
VIGSALSAIVEFYAERTAKRLALDAASVLKNPIKAEAPSHQC